MFGQKTVLIVGAGASAESTMPTGAELKERIAKLLNFVHPAIDDEFRAIIALRFKNEEKKYLESATKLAKLVGKFDSIDEALNWFSDRPEILSVGKAAIVRAILLAEKNSQLFNNVTPNMAPALDYSENWLVPFLLMSIRSLTREEAKEKLFENVTVINFNYDRTIEHFIFSELQRSYKFGTIEAQTMVSRLAPRIIRPYGSVGPLPWFAQPKKTGIQFGADLGRNHEELFRLSKNIATYTEKNLEEKIANEIKTVIQVSRVVIFLGFGFHQQNMQLLKQMQTVDYRRVFGTIRGISNDNEKELIPYIASTVGCLPANAQFLYQPAYKLLEDLKPTISALVS